MKLTILKIQKLPEGMHADGHGLYLRVQASGSKSWIFRFQLNGIRREMGIGKLAHVPLALARARAAELALKVKNGIDPIDERNQLRNEEAEQQKQEKIRTITFGEIAEQYLHAKKSGWKNPKHAAQWQSTLDRYVLPKIGTKPVSEICIEDILSILKPIWTTKTETSSRVRSRIELVISFAKALKLFTGENPATWRGNLDALLPKPGKVAVVRHFPALPYSRMPEFIQSLRLREGAAVKALEFAILTAARSGEVRLATWSEIDLSARVWMIPGSRMKAGRPHRIPLSSAAMNILEELPRDRSHNLIFQGMRAGRPLSDMTLSSLIKRMNAEIAEAHWVDPRQDNAPVVPHGFRSTFRDWAAETTTFPREMADLALAHTISDKVEAAYRRSDMFEKRREMMESWAQHCHKEPK